MMKNQLANSTQIVLFEHCNLKCHFQKRIILNENCWYDKVEKSFEKL